MDDKIEIPVSGSHKKLLQEIANDILDMDVTRAISAIVSKEGKNFVYLDPSELDELVGNICFISNHEENNPKFVKQLKKLIDHLEKYLDDCSY